MLLCLYKKLERTEKTLLQLSYEKDAVLIEAVNNNSYDDALINNWGKEDIIIIEHDIIYTKEQLHEIRNCKHFLCTFNYYLYPITTKLKEPVLAHRQKINNAFVWNNEMDAEANTVGFGMTKISREFQMKHKPNWEKGDWKNLDTRFSLWVMGLGYKFQIHKDIVEHNHKEQ